MKRSKSKFGEWKHNLINQMIKGKENEKTYNLFIANDVLNSFAIRSHTLTIPSTFSFIKIDGFSFLAWEWKIDLFLEKMFNFQLINYHRTLNFSRRKESSFTTEREKMYVKEFYDEKWRLSNIKFKWKKY